MFCFFADFLFLFYFLFQFNTRKHFTQEHQKNVHALTLQLNASKHKVEQLLRLNDTLTIQAEEKERETLSLTTKLEEERQKWIEMKKQKKIAEEQQQHKMALDVQMKEQNRKESELEKQENDSAVTEALDMITRLEQEMVQKRKELTLTKQEVNKMKKAVSIADTAAAAMARGREDAVAQLETLRASVLKEAEKAKETEKVVERKIPTPMTSSTSCQTSEMPPPYAAGTNAATSAAKTTAAVLALTSKLKKRESTILQQAEWREVHMDKELVFVQNIRNLRRENKALLLKEKQLQKTAAKSTHQKTRAMPALTAVTTKLMAIKSIVQQHSAGQSQSSQTENVPRAVPTLTEAFTTLVTIASTNTQIHNSTAQSVEMSRTMPVLKETPTTLVAIASNPKNMTNAGAQTEPESQVEQEAQHKHNKTNTATSEELNVLRHALRKLQEELSQVRIEYDTQHGITETYVKAVALADSSGTCIDSVPQKNYQKNYQQSSGSRVILGELN